MNYRNKMKSKAVLVALLLSLPCASIHASGWPVIDVAAIAEMIKNTLQQYEHFQQTYKHWKQQVETWQAEIQSRIRGALSKFDKVEDSRKLTDAEIQQIFDKRKKRCNQLSNEQSKSLCNNAVDLDKEKVKYYFDAEKIVAKQMQELDLKVAKYQELLKGSNNLEQLNSAKDDIQNQLQHIENIMTMYERKIKLLEAKQEMIQKARITIANEQLHGNYSSDTVTRVAGTVVYGAVVTTLKTQAKDYKNKAEALRTGSASKSNKAFYR